LVVVNTVMEILGSVVRREFYKWAEKLLASQEVQCLTDLECKVIMYV